MTHKSTGTVKYRNNSVVLDIDPEIARYYQWQLSQYLPKFNKPLYAPHITIIRDGEIVIWDTAYENLRVDFYYHTYIINDELYYWLHVDKNDILSDIRKYYGLDWCFDKQKEYHITIANIKGIS